MWLAKMGLKGPGASIRRDVAKQRKRRALPWKKAGLSRVERVIAFPQFLPITKGKLIGRNLELLADQLKFIGRFDTRVRLGIFSQPRGNGKTGLIAGLQLIASILRGLRENETRWRFCLPGVCEHWTQMAL